MLEQRLKTTRNLDQFQSLSAHAQPLNREYRKETLVGYLPGTLRIPVIATLIPRVQYSAEDAICDCLALVGEDVYVSPGIFGIYIIQRVSHLLSTKS